MSRSASRYCGLDAHQALAEIGSDAVADLSGNGSDGGVAVAEEPPVEEPVPAGETPAVEAADAVAGSPADELEPQADAAEPTGEAS